MLDDNPVLKERLMAFGAFAGITVFAVAAVDVMVTGGFDFAAHRAPYNREQPSAYVRVMDAAQYVNDRFREISWDEPALIESAAAVTTTDALVGESDGAPPPLTSEQTSDETLSMEIEALYSRQQEAADDREYENVRDEGVTEDPAYEEEFSPEEAQKLVNVSENASPW